MTSKFRKLLKNPGFFFRDYFNKRYPIINCELKITEDEETAIFHTENLIHKIESQFALNYDVDIVYTWVNDKDTEWQEKKNSFLPKVHIDNVALNDARFEDHNELYYSVLSVKKNLPWVRNIYIVSDNQKPIWLNEFKHVFLIDHKDIIDHNFLPTFNSHVIEAHLHKIPNLSENFIYFNDDVMVAKPLSRLHFFRNNGLSSLFLSNKSLREMQNKGVETPTLRASFNSKKILLDRFDCDIDYPLVHTYIPLKKSIFEKVYSENLNRIHEFLPNKFRKDNDLNLASFFVPWFMYWEGKSVISTEICYYFNIRSPYAMTQYKKLLNLKGKELCPHSFCVNDFKSSCNDVKNFDENLNKFLTQYFTNV